MKFRTSILLVTSIASLGAAEFQTGQAARAVLGQSSFTSREQGIKASSLAIAKGNLYVSDSSHHVLAFDLSKIPDVREDLSGRRENGCTLCGFAPITTANQSVLPGVAGVSVWGKSVAIADSASHRVLVWRDSTATRLDHSPDIVLGRSNDGPFIGPKTLVDPVAVALDGKRLFVGDAALHRILVWNSLPSFDDQPADAVLGQIDFASSLPAETPGPDSITVPAALASDGSNLFVADSSTRRILVFSPGDSFLPTGAVVNAASLVSTPLAPGTLIAVNAAGLSEEQASAPAETGSGPLPKRLGGVELLFDGQALPLIAVSPQTIGAQLPYDLGGRTAASLYVRTEHSSGSTTVTTPVALKIVQCAPGLYAFPGSEPRPGILLHAGAGTAHEDGSPVTESSPAKPGEILIAWAAGLGPIAEEGTAAIAGRAYGGAAGELANPVSAQIDGEPVLVLSAKLPTGAIGVYEVRVAVPDFGTSGTEAHLTIAQNGIGSNTVVFPVRHAGSANAP